MVLSEEKAKEFEEASLPLIQWLNRNCHPHVEVVVTPLRSELLEGILSTGGNHATHSN